MPRPLVLALVVVAAPFLATHDPLSAGAGRFSVAAPEGGTVQVLAVDPTDPAFLYAGSRTAGVFRSLDGGRSWRPARRGLTGEQVTALAVAPSAPRVLYAGTAGSRGGVFRSDDRGASWAAVADGGPRGAWGLAIHPTDPDVVVVANGDELWKTLDGGRSWGDVTPPSAPDLFYTYRIPIFDRDQPSTVYVGSNGGVAKTTDLGATWTRAEPGAFVLALVSDPRREQTLWAGVEGGVLRSDDGGESFRFLPLPVDPYDPVTALALDAGEKQIVYAAAGPSSLEETIFRSDDGGETWAPLLSTTEVLSLAAHPDDPGTVWAGLRSLGVLATTDGGATWRASRRGLRAAGVTALAVDPRRAGTLVAGLDDAPSPLARSEDGGKTWTAVTLDLEPLRAGARTDALIPDASRPGWLYGSIWGLVLLSRDFGRTWEPLAGHPPFPVISLLVTGASGALVAATQETIPCDLGFGCPPRTVLHLVRSTDGGASWQEVLPPHDFIGTVAMARAPSDPSVVYLAAGGLLSSGDGGATWRRVETSSADLPIFDLVVHPLDPRVLYAGTRLHAGGVVRSLDGGATWQPPGSGLPRGTFASQAVLDVLIDPQDPQRLYAAADVGVFESGDGGETWSPFSEGLRGLPVSVLGLDATGPGTLYAGGSSGGGLFARTRVPASCAEGPTTLCLEGGRFRVSVHWEDSEGRQGQGRAAPWLASSGGFWFFAPTSLDLVVKVVDGRPLNGHFWVFVASLSDVAFELSVVDTRTGAVWSHANPSGHLASHADLAAF